MQQVYLDYNATTPLDEGVLEAMLPYLREQFGNPSSVHATGRLARAAIDRARQQVAELVGVAPGQVIFTSGGTEANNLALWARCAAAKAPGRLAVSAIEHPSVLAPAEAWAARGWQLDRLPVDADGRLQMAALERSLASGTELVSVMLANNETGVLQDIPAIAGRVRAAGAVLHTDAVQAAGKLPLDFAASGAGLMSLSAHKIYGPKGVGALIVDRALELVPLLVGGGQERGLRAGTENLAGIVGFGAAAELARQRLRQDAERLRALRERLEEQLAALPGVSLFARAAPRLPNTLQLALDGIDGEALLLQLDREGLAVSSGSACSSGSTEPSHVLTAMGVEAQRARGAIRISLGRHSSEADIDRLVGVLRRQQEWAARAAAW
ncbi:cysteine desulfurase family protein [Thiohalobacter sp. IOR34]|uniref:cysteine desulfurase family protein n=1 Tax=Thiohalobacter sp. IOR34 TaxID=3057176 RepID=UPI0025AEE373|nr:cysteine desulfurase family protein [Thiohalobacter sp. IOR34]WJW76256.1 cysteine desulfurase family protein [Thiohalobacter sp. IOR34]